MLTILLVIPRCRRLGSRSEGSARLYIEDLEFVWEVRRRVGERGR